MTALALLSLSVTVSPASVSVLVGQSATLSVSVLDSTGKRGAAVPAFIVLPSDIGTVRGNEFTANECGLGLIVVSAAAGGDTVTAVVPVRVAPGELRVLLTPRLAELGPREPKRFAPVVVDKTDSEVDAGIEWRVFPPWLGTVTDGLFVPSGVSGTGSVVVIARAGARKGYASARLKIGDDSKLKLFPEELSAFVGDRVKLTTRFEGGTEHGEPEFRVEPESIGTIDADGIFLAKSPGRGLIVASVRTPDAAVTRNAFVLVTKRPATPLKAAKRVEAKPRTLFIRPGQRRKVQLVTEREGEVVWRSRGNGTLEILQTEGKRWAWVFGGLPGAGVLSGALLGERKLVRRIPFIVGETRLAVEPNEVRVNVGDEVQFVASGTRLARLTDWRVFPAELGRVTPDGKFTALATGRGFIVCTLPTEVGGGGGFASVRVK